MHLSQNVCKKPVEMEPTLYLETIRSINQREEECRQSCRRASWLALNNWTPVSKQEHPPHWASRTLFILTVFWRETINGSFLMGFDKRGGVKVKICVLSAFPLNGDKRGVWLWFVLQPGRLPLSTHLKSPLRINRRKALSDMWKALLRHPAQDCLKLLHLLLQSDCNSKCE